MTDDAKKASATRSLVTSTKMDLLKYEIMSLISGEELDTKGVAALASQARVRFNGDMSWSIGATGLKRIHRDARAPLTELFDDFRKAGGIVIVVIGVVDGYVGTAFQMCAFNAGNMPLKCVKDAAEAETVIKKARADHTKV